MTATERNRGIARAIEAARICRAKEETEAKKSLWDAFWRSRHGILARLTSLRSLPTQGCVRRVKRCLRATDKIALAVGKVIGKYKNGQALSKALRLHHQ
jgi:hypothetical protein